TSPAPPFYQKYLVRRLVLLFKRDRPTPTGGAGPGAALLSPAATKGLIASFLAQGGSSDGAGPSAAEYSDRLAALTGREREVLVLVAGGHSNDEIAERLVVSPLTVKTHVNRAMAKLGARDRAQLVVIAYESGLVRPRVE
ncbi:response regulator transcription factor, partial [Streptomyces sp. NPDC056305]|uniref:helix-turn-helix transcriptional regulator n=1 Tax=Streptomyces sp. NPDC056305 TaxID=3345779 RepID=UPI0035E19BD2